MTFKRRGRFLDTDDGKWVIEKDPDFKFYIVYNCTTHEYVMLEGTKHVRTWRELREARRYVWKQYL